MSESQVQAPEGIPVPGPAPKSESETTATVPTNHADSTPQPKGKKKKDTELDNSIEFNPAENNPPIPKVEKPEEPEQSPNLTLSQMVLALPEKDKQNIYDTLVSYVNNGMERDTILHSVFQKAEKALVESFKK